DAPGHCRRLAHQQLRHRQSVDLADIDRLAVMLADIGVAEAELVGQHDLGEVLFVGLRGGGVGTKAVGENSEFHFQSSMSAATYDPGGGLTTLGAKRALVVDMLISIL